MTKIKSPNDVNTRKDFIEYVASLAQEATTDDIENRSTARYLEAAAAWAQDSGGAYARTGEDVPELSPEAWRFIARMLDAALVYE
jgi:hypothetical protein